MGLFFVILGIIVLSWKLGVFQGDWTWVLDVLPYLVAVVLMLLGITVIHFGRKERKIEGD